MVQQLATKDEFQSKVLNEKSMVVAVDYTATWCGPCRMIGPVFEELSKQYEGKMLFFKVDVDENAEVAEEQGISAMPTFKFYKDGKQVKEMVGASKEKLESLVQELSN